MILPLNRPLVFTISMPDIRRVEGSYQIRRNVAKVVQILNRQAQETDKKRSKIIVKFAARYEFLLFNFSLNDFSMVVAPFLRLKSDRYDSFKIEHLPRVMLHHAKLDTYCNYLEEAMRDGLDNTGPLFYQQAILDLKVPLCIYEDHFVNKTPTVLARPLEMRLGEEIQKGLQKVRAWHIAVGRVEPKWVDTLIRMDEESLVLNEAERATLWRDIFQGVGASHVGYWAAGLCKFRVSLCARGLRLLMYML